MPIFGRARKTSGPEGTAAGVQKGELTARSRATSFDLPTSTITLNPRRWSEKQPEAPRSRSGSNASSVNGGHSAYRQLNFERGSYSKPPTAGPPRDRSSSLFARSKDKLFRRLSNSSKPTTLETPVEQPPNTSTPAPDFRCQDEPSSPPAIDESEVELSRLRDDAARSIGMTPPPPSLDDVPMKSMRILNLENLNGTRHAMSFSDNCAALAPPRIDPVNLLSSHSTRSSSRTDQAIPSLPPFPCAWSALASHIQLHSPVNIYRSSTGLSTIFSKHAGRSWKSRHLALSVYNTESNSLDGRHLRTDTLHIFKGSFPDDEEVDRLYLTVFSAVTPAGPDVPEVGNRHNVIQVSGFANGAALEDNVVTSGHEVSWLFQVPDGVTMRAWALKLEREVLDQRNVVNTVARNFPERRASSPVRINSVRQSTLSTHKQPVEKLAFKGRPGSPLGPPRTVAGGIPNGATVQNDYRPISAVGEYSNGHSASSSYAPRRSLQATSSVASQSPLALSPERNKPYPHISHIRATSLGGVSSDDLYARSAVARFLSGLLDSDDLTAQRSLSRSGSPASLGSLPAPPRSPRPLRGTTSPTKLHSSHPATALAPSHLGMRANTGDEVDGYLASAYRAVSPLDHWDEALRQRVDTPSHDNRLTSVFGEDPEDEGGHTLAEDRGQGSRTRTSSASSRDPRLDRSNSRRTRGRESLPPMPPPPRGRPPDAPGSPSSSCEGAQPSPGNGTMHTRSRIPSIRPSTTFGGSSDQVTPPPSVKAPGVTPSSHSMRSQLSNGTTRTHTTNYEGAVQDGRSSRNGSIFAAANGAASDQYSGSWAILSGVVHPYATPSRSSHSYGSEASNPPSRRTSHEDSAPTTSERKGQKSPALPLPRPAPLGGLPPTPADLVTQRLPKQRHGSSGSAQYAALNTDGNEHGIERSRPPVSVPSSYRDRSRRLSALPHRAVSPSVGPTQDPFLVSPASSVRMLDGSADSPNSAFKYARPNSPSFALGGSPVRRISSSRRSAQNPDLRGSPYNSFLEFDTPGSDYASLPPAVRPFPLPSESLPPHNVLPLPPITPRNIQ